MPSSSDPDLAFRATMNPKIWVRFQCQALRALGHKPEVLKSSRDGHLVVTANNTAWKQYIEKYGHCWQIVSRYPNKAYHDPYFKGV